MQRLQVSLVLLIFAFASVTTDSTHPVPRFNGNIWAVLVAGSSGYENYRHQADVCHAYQVLRSHGIPDERIIVMMYDDIAHNRENPTKGIIINHPHGKDVYTGVPKDYTGPEVRNNLSFLNSFFQINAYFSGESSQFPKCPHWQRNSFT